ncbi:MAG: hypothetical protein WAU68_07240 [Vitreimonas sp.]
MGNGGPASDDPLKHAIEAGVPQIYFNGFASGLGNGDVSCVLQRNGEPAAIINMSFTLAKTLAVSLGAIISHIEERAGRDIMTTQDIDGFFSSQETKQ